MIRVLAYAFTAVLLLGAVVAQFFLAGVGLFVPGDDFSGHRQLGSSWIPVLSLVLFLSAAIGGRSRWDVTAASFVFVLVLVTGALASSATSDPGLAALHPVAALLVVAFVASLVVRSLMAVRAAHGNGG